MACREHVSEWSAQSQPLILTFSEVLPAEVATSTKGKEKVAVCRGWGGAMGELQRWVGSSQQSFRS